MRYSDNTVTALNINTDVPAVEKLSQLIANGDFTLASLAATVNSVPFKPNFLGALGIYEYSNELSPDVKVEFDGQVINIIQSSAPGTPGIAGTLVDRKMVSLTSPRIAKTITVEAAELSRIRGIASGGLDSFDTRVDRHLRNCVRDIESTWEWHRLTAAQGILQDADGSTIMNYFTALGVTQPTFDLLAGTTSTGWLQTKFADLLNKLEDALGNFAPGGDPPLIIYGRTLWKEFISHPNVYTAYQYFEANQGKNPQRNDLRYQDFEFCGFRHRQYRGSYTASNTTVFGSGTTTQYLSATTAQVIIPEVPGTYLALCTPPRDVLELVDQPGQPLIMTAHMLPHQAGIEFRVQSNIAHIMTRPLASIQVTSST